MEPHVTEAVIAGLVGVWRGAPELRYVVEGKPLDLLVEDGPLLRDVEDPRSLSVGVSAAVAEGAQHSRSFDLGGQLEEVDVGCLLEVWRADADSAAVARLRREGFEVLRELERRLAAARDLGGAVAWARVVRSAYRPGYAEDEAAGTASTGALIDFVVRADVRRVEGM